ncbi:MAG TPA: molybdopterin-dependent oxidoreductase [Sporichthyaceae bacterium]
MIADLEPDMGNETVVHTVCRICASSCGIDATVDVDRNKVLNIAPDRHNVQGWRDFCRKGQTAHEAVDHPRRIRRPMRRVGDRYVEASWAEATADIADRLNAIIDRHGPDAVGSYSGNPMGMAFGVTAFYTGLLDAIGTQNRYWVGSIDQNNVHVVARALYGSELISLVPDIDSCDFFLLIGMDPGVSKFGWVDCVQEGWHRMLARQREGAQVVVVDPRRSFTAQRADLHIAPAPGSDWALLLGLVKTVLDESLQRPNPSLPLSGLEEIRRLVDRADPADLSRRCDVPLPVIQDLARRFAAAPRAMCLTHTGVAHSEHGTLGEWLGQVLNLLTGRIDAAGGRRHERGVVDAGMVAALFTPQNPHRTRLRDLPAIAGAHSLAELPDEITTAGPGQIRALLIGNGNPVTSGPDGSALDDALSTLELLVVFDLVQRESHRHAHWLIPGTHWLERGELHPFLCSVSEQPVVQYGRQAVQPLPGIKPEWEFFTDLALAMDRNLFGKPGVNRIIRALRRLAKVIGRPGLQFNPEWISRLMVLVGRRVRWRDILAAQHGLRYSERRYGDLTRALRTPDQQVHLAPASFVTACLDALAQPAERSAEYPYLLINRRHRESMNSWLNDLPGLHRNHRRNVAELHDADAEAIGVRNGDLLEVASATGSFVVPVEISDAVRRGVVCVPHGWGSRTFDPHGERPPGVHGSNRNLVVSNRAIDRLSQTPAFNSTPVCLRRVDPFSDAEAAVEDGTALRGLRSAQRV